MRIYLASKFSNNAWMREVRDKLISIGHTVTSRWIDLHPDVVGSDPTATTKESINSYPGDYAIYAHHDVQDLAAADTFIHFTPDGNGGKGGRHVEFGMALVWGKRVILVGERENVFHTLPGVEHYNTVDEMIYALGAYQPSRWL